MSCLPPQHQPHNPHLPMMKEKVDVSGCGPWSTGTTMRCRKDLGNAGQKHHQGGSLPRPWVMSNSRPAGELLKWIELLVWPLPGHYHHETSRFDSLRLQLYTLLKAQMSLQDGGNIVPFLGLLSWPRRKSFPLKIKGRRDFLIQSRSGFWFYGKVAGTGICSVWGISGGICKNLNVNEIAANSEKKLTLPQKELW